MPGGLLRQILLILSGRKLDMETTRLRLKPLQESDTAFIFELVNTEGWVKFIGNRNVQSEADALTYIRKILDNTAVRYWVVSIKETGQPAGLVTFIQRDYLPHPDIGFAFLPVYARKGFGYEAASALLQYLWQTEQHRQICATTIPGNIASIKLLRKLGFRFKQAIVANKERLFVYYLMTGQ